MTAAVAAVIAVAVGILTLGDQSPSTTATSARLWTLLPPLPDRATTDVDGIVFFGLGQAVPLVAVVDRGPSDSRSSRVMSWRWHDGRWRPGAASPLVIDRDQQIFAAGDDPCLAAPIKGKATVSCLVNGTWRRHGDPLFTADDSLARPTLSAYASSVSGHVAARVTTTTVSDPTASSASTSRPQTTWFARTRSGAWRSLGPIASADSAPGGSFRPFAFQLQNAQCFAATLLGQDTNRSPTIGGSCRSVANPLRARRLPPLDVSRVAGERAISHRVALNSDGAVGRGPDGFFGIDVFDGPSTSWQVWRLRGRTWAPTRLSTTPSGWNSQGSLYRVGDLVLALRFDQQGDLNTGLRSRIAVRGLTEDLRAGDVGEPLVDGTAHAPLYWDLAAGRDAVYVVATSPNPNSGRNDVRLWVTPRSRVARSARGW